VVGAWGAPNNQRHRNLTPNREPLRTVAHVVLICSLCDNAIPAKDHHSRRRACALSFWRIEERRKPLSLRFFPRPPGYIRLTPAFAPTPSSSARALKRSRHRKCLFLLPPSTPSWQLPSPTTTFLHLVRSAASRSRHHRSASRAFCASSCVSPRQPDPAVTPLSSFLCLLPWLSTQATTRSPHPQPESRAGGAADQHVFCALWGRIFARTFALSIRIEAASSTKNSRPCSSLYFYCLTFFCSSPRRAADLKDCGLGVLAYRSVVNTCKVIY
jgi:hypothetical protein